MELQVGMLHIGLTHKALIVSGLLDIKGNETFVIVRMKDSSSLETGGEWQRIDIVKYSRRLGQFIAAIFVEEGSGNCTKLEYEGKHEDSESEGSFTYFVPFQRHQEIMLCYSE